MAKAPRPGQVKTRLCPPLGPRDAAALSRAFLLDRIEQVRGLGARLAIAYAPADAQPVFRALAPGFELIPQRGPDLGARMSAAIEDLVAAGAAGAILVGTDSPTLPTEYLAEAAGRLAASDADLVLGPSEDGGYYLIGLRAPRPELFREIAWSTPAVLPETIHRARALGLRTASLPAWFDVDTGDDLDRLERELAARPGPEPRHTREYFAAGRGGAHGTPRAGTRKVDGWLDRQPVELAGEPGEPRSGGIAAGAPRVHGLGARPAQEGAR
jgi:rSAM/selenodomain-associated transferase 1